MKDRIKDDEPLNDIVCTLFAQIFDSFPIVCVIEDSIYCSHSGIPKEFSLIRMKIICDYISAMKMSIIAPGSMDQKQTTNYKNNRHEQRQDSSSYIISEANTHEYQDLMEELLIKVM